MIADSPAAAKANKQTAAINRRDWVLLGGALGGAHDGGTERVDKEQSKQ